MDFKDIKTFGKGKWIVLPSDSSKQVFEENCALLNRYCLNTPLCLSDMKKVKEALKESSFFIFIDNNDKLQIIGDFSYKINNIRGVTDGVEQNINSEYVDVANELLSSTSLIGKKSWLHQINWMERLRKYQQAFADKQYDKIEISSLINDLGYNGYSLHFPGSTKPNNKRIYYPIAKRKLLLQPMLKPLIAKHLGCKTFELAVGKYTGNGEGVKYVVGDVISKYLHKNCSIEKVYGSINIENYLGEFNPFKIKSTLNFKVTGTGEHPFNLDILDVISKKQLNISEKEWINDENRQTTEFQR